MRGFPHGAQIFQPFAFHNLLTVVHVSVRKRCQVHTQQSFTSFYEVLSKENCVVVCVALRKLRTSCGRDFVVGLQIRTVTGTYHAFHWDFNGVCNQSNFDPKF